MSTIKPAAQIQQIVTAGPSIYMDEPCVAVVFDFEQHFGEAKPLTISSLYEGDKFFSAEVNTKLNMSQLYSNAGELVAILTNVLQQVRFEMSLDYKVGRRYDGRSYIAVSYFISDAALSALRFSFDVIASLLSKRKHLINQLQQRFSQQLQLQAHRQPNQPTTAMISAAKQLAIPVYEFPNVDKVLSYGQGEYAILFKSSESHFDSQIGTELQGNKAITNILLKELGYPATQQYSVSSLSQAREVMFSLGFPLVVKPDSQGMGRGVSSSIQSQQEFEAAFKLAKQHGAVIVEKHVEGYDHRIVVADGKVIGALCRIPAMVIGDGMHSVRELVVLENDARKKPENKHDIVKSIPLDDALHTALAKQNLDVESVPKKGVKVELRSNANLATGATFKDVIDEVHPDNMTMAADIARYFRLNTIGLDFITPDISKSWREAGVVLEINDHPGMRYELAHTQLNKKFPANNGRIPILLLIDFEVEQQKKVFAGCIEKEAFTGFVSSDEVMFLGIKRRIHTTNIHRRCLPLIKDTACKQLVVAVTIEELITQGLPLDFFDNCYIAKQAHNRASEVGLLPALEKATGKLKLV